jgi:hypothetical protein
MRSGEGRRPSPAASLMTYGILLFLALMSQSELKKKKKWIGSAKK